MLRLGIISNPFAKLIKRHPDYNTKLWYALENYGQLEITRNLNELRTVCLEFAERGINLVGIIGGDGSISLVLSHLKHAYSTKPLPKILILKGGTINFLAANLGITASPLAGLTQALEFIKQKRPFFETVFPTLQINDQIGFLFANGIAARFLEDFYQNKTNSIGAICKLGCYFIDGVLDGKLNGKFAENIYAQPMSIQTSSDKSGSLPEKIKTNHYYVIFASTVPKIPFGVHFFRKLKPGETQAEMVTFQQKEKNALKVAFQMIINRPIEKIEGGLSSVFTTATICSKNQTLYSLDGELFHAPNGEIKIKPGPVFTFCTPFACPNP